ncbi:hypothetical protein NX059_003210 [Plenodomus lindquistii]|nr:hypothetical protein NX059_003210 [Plenodomus lindquistii]
MAITYEKIAETTVPDKYKSLLTKNKGLPLTGGLLKLIVGDNFNLPEFYIHEGILVARSEFFKNTMSAGWKEAEEKVVRLPNDDPGVVALYEQLVYTGRIPIFDTDAERLSIWAEGLMCGDQSLCQYEYTSLSKLYVLADKLHDIGAKNIVIRAMIEKIMYEESVRLNQGIHLPGTDAIKIIYEGTAD